MLSLVVCFVYAQEFTTAGIQYNVTSAIDKTVEVVEKYPDYRGSITIPSTVLNSDNGISYQVTKIGDYAFNYSNYAKFNYTNRKFFF